MRKLPVLLGKDDILAKEHADRRAQLLLIDSEEEQDAVHLEDAIDRLQVVYHVVRPAVVEFVDKNQRSWLGIHHDEQAHVSRLLRE